MRTFLRVFLILAILYSVPKFGYSQLSGSYTIGGSSASYSNITAAVSALTSNGVNGAVVFTINAGQYNEDIYLSSAISGASATNTVTFKGVGKYQVTLKDQLPVYLYNCDYVKVEDVTLESTRYYAVYMNYSDYCKFENCILKTPTATSSSYRTIYSRYSNYSSIKNNRIMGGYYGIYLYGSGSSYSNNYGHVIEGNDIVQSYYYGMYHRYGKNNKIVGNRIDSLRNSSSVLMIYNYRCTEISIERNRLFYNNQYDIGIYCYYSNRYGSSSSRTRVVNNFIGGDVSTYMYGIYVGSSSYRVDVLNNTVISNGSSTSGSCLYITSGSGHNVQNNNFYQAGSTGSYAIYVSSVSYLDTFDYNNIHSENSSRYAYFSGTRSSLSTLKSSSTSFNKNSIDTKLKYASNRDYQMELVELDNKGNRWVGVNDDISGRKRPASPDTKVDIGCTDYYLPPNDAGISRFSDAFFCAGTVSVKAYIKNYGTKDLTSSDVDWAVSVNGGSYTKQTSTSFSGKLSSGGESSITLGNLTLQTGSTYRLKAWTSKPNKVADVKSLNDTSFATKKPAMSGTFTVGKSGADFPNIDTALLVVKSNKVCGPVTLRLADTTFAGQLVIKEIQGASATNTIRIVGAGADKTILSHTASGSGDWATVLLDGAKHVVLDSMTIAAKGSSYGSTVWFTNNADNNVVKNCHLIGDPSTTRSERSNVVFSSSSSSFSYGSSGTNNVISNNLIRGGYWAVAMYGGNSSTFSTYTSGNQVVNNRMYQQYYYGIYAYRTRNKVIEGNMLDSFRSTSAYGVYNYYCGNDRFIGNKINTPYMGIYQRYANYNSYGATVADSSFFINNMITGQSYASIYSYYGYRTMFYHNSCLTPSSSSYGCYFRYNYYSQWKNNSFVNEGGYAAYWYRMSNIASGAIDYNNYYAPNSSYLAYVSGSRGQLSDIRTATSGDANSINVDPEYFSSTDLHCLSVNVNNRGTKLSYVKTDFDGDTRPYAPDTIPDIGADEFNLPPYDLDITTVSPTVFAQGNNKIVVRLRNNGINNIVGDTAYLSYKINGGSAIRDTLFIKGTLAYGTDTTFEFATPHNVTGTSGITLCAEIDTSIKGDPDTLEKICNNACVGAAGTYSIKSNGSGDFKTIGDAVSFLGGCGVGGPVVFNVDSGVYQERVVVGNIAGASATNSVTFDGQGISTIEYAGTSTASATVYLSGASHVTFQNFTVRNTGSYYGVVFQIANGSSNININNNNIRSSTTATSSYSGGVIFSSQSNGYVFDRISSNGVECHVKDNDITGGYVGISLQGASTNDYIKNNYFTGNKISNFYYYGLYAYYATDLLIEGNEIFGPRNTNGYGIVYSYSNNGSISANTVHDLGQIGIYIYRVNYYKTGATKVHNNMIYGTFRSSSPYFLYAYYANDIDFYHNTLHNTTATNGYLAYTRRSYRQNWVNNILANMNNSGSMWSLYISNYSTDTIDYNNVISKSQYYVYHDAVYSDLAAWQSGQPTYNQNSISETPLFVSSTDPHVTRIKDSPRGAVLGLTMDVDGDSRCMFSPTIGADESGFQFSNAGANFSVDDTVYINSPTKIINATSKTTPGEHLWYVNDSLVSSKHSLIHEFKNSGYDTVKLVSTTCAGTDSAMKYVFVDKPSAVPVTDFVALKNQIDPFDEIELFDISSNGPTGWEWEIFPKSVYSPLVGYSITPYSFENNTDSSSQNPVLFFFESGKYTVKLTTKNHLGRGSTVTKVAYIEVSAVANMCNYLSPTTNFSSGTFYDDGGPTGNYSDNLNGSNVCTYLIDPCASEVTLTFKSLDIRSGSYPDYLRIYDGDDNTGTPLWNVSTSTRGINGTLANADTSYTAKSGKMYIEFESDRRYNTAGWHAKWTSVPGNFAVPKAKFSVPDTVCDNSWFFMEIDTTNNVNTNYRVKYDTNALAYAVKGGYMVKYSKTGTESIGLVTDNCGGIDSVDKTVIVISPNTAPKPDFETDIQRPTTSDFVTLTDKSYRCVDEVKWIISPNDFEYVNNTDSHDLMPQIRFKKKGCFDVSLIAGKNGRYDTLSRTCFIEVIEYCPPAVNDLISDVGISRVVFNQIDNSSPTGEDGYTDYTADHKTSVEIGGSYSVTVERKVAINKMNRAVWIDWNQDGDFDDSLELVGKETSGKTLSWTQSFTVPNINVAVLGATRMRVGTNIGNLKNRPCGPNAYGEFEDYRLNITPDITLPIVKLRGQDTMTLESCHTFTDPGILATDNVTITSNLIITIDSKLDASKEGFYEIKYLVTDEAGNSTQIKRIVHVTADVTDPVLTLRGIKTVHHPVLTSYVDSGVVATDLCDGNMTPQVLNPVVDTIVGLYTITYTATDKAGNSTVLTRTVIVEDKVKPNIQITGADTMYVEVFNKFVDPGYVADDNYDANPIVEVTNNVRINQLGTYSVIYSVKDASGNVGIDDKRIVIVGDSTKPEISLIGEANEQIDVYDRYIDLRVDVADNYWSSNGIEMEVKGSFYDAFANGIADSIGNFQIEYHATDGSGNTNVVVRDIEVVDSESPVLHFDDILKICRWDDQADLLFGVTAEDNYYPADQLTISVVENNVDIHKDGFYSIKYQVEDGSGNKSYPEVRMIIVEHCNVGVETNILNEAVNLYPNPSSGQMVIELEFPRELDVELSITDIRGQLIETIDVGRVSKAQYQRDLSYLGSGIYLLQVRSGRAMVVRRIEIIK